MELELRAEVKKLEEGVYKIEKWPSLSYTTLFDPRALVVDGKRYTLEPCDRAFRGELAWVDFGGEKTLGIVALGESYTPDSLMLTDGKGWFVLEEEYKWTRAVHIFDELCYITEAPAEHSRTSQKKFVVICRSTEWVKALVSDTPFRNFQEQLAALFGGDPDEYLQVIDLTEIRTKNWWSDGGEAWVVVHEGGITRIWGIELSKGEGQIFAKSGDIERPQPLLGVFYLKHQKSPFLDDYEPHVVLVTPKWLFDTSSKFMGAWRKYRYMTSTIKKVEQPNKEELLIFLDDGMEYRFNGELWVKIDGEWMEVEWVDKLPKTLKAVLLDGEREEG